MKVIDLRSDTVTKPTQQMKQVILEAEVGDDVFGEDECTNIFQEKMAALGTGLFVPSGTMSNQLALKVLAEPSNEVLIDHKGHILQYETWSVIFIIGTAFSSWKLRKVALNK